MLCQQYTDAPRCAQVVSEERQGAEPSGLDQPVDSVLTTATLLCSKHLYLEITISAAL